MKLIKEIVMSTRTFTREQIEALRDIRFRRTKQLQVRTENQALEFINDVGFCFAFKSHNSELPCLGHAASGERSPKPSSSHDDPVLSFVWNLKDSLPEKKALYYGKALKKRPTMISLEYFPYFYVLSGNNGKSNCYLDQYKHGELSESAKNIIEALLANSPQLTRDLKIASGLSSPGQRREFDQAMAELQMKMHVVKIAEIYEPFSFVWETVLKRFPKEISLAKRISTEKAREKILIKYFENLIVSNTANIDRMFGWGKDVIEKCLSSLVEKKIISPDVRIEREKGKWYILANEL